MSAPKLLNLDDLPTAAAEKTIVLGGVKHEMQPLNVGQFIDAQREAKKVDVEGDPAATTESFIKLIISVFPTLKHEQVRALSFSKLQTILQFISKSADEIVEQAQAGQPVAEGDAKN